MFGRTTAAAVHHPYSALSLPGVRFLRAEVQGIDPVSRRVTTDVETLEADALVVALGADLVPSATPGLLEGGHEFYTEAGAFGLRQVLADFDGGHVVIGVTSTPFKCPPAPSETALLVHDLLRDRGLLGTSDVTLVMPMGVPIPPSPAASVALLEAFEQRGIHWRPGQLVRALLPEQHRAVLADGSELPYDLFLGIPVHRAPQVVLDSGLAEGGWIPVDPLTLRTRFEGVYAVGDVTSVGTPKAGVFAEGQAAVVAAEVLALASGASTPTYDGRGLCYMEMGGGRVAKVDVTFVSGQPPQGSMQGPDVAFAADKEAFGSTRVGRWFGG
jgi:sulfide:quinone oxidoreductase